MGGCRDSSAAHQKPEQPFGYFCRYADVKLDFDLRFRTTFFHCELGVRCESTYFLNPRLLPAAGGSPFIGNRVGEVYPVRYGEGRTSRLQRVNHNKLPPKSLEYI